MTFFSDQYELLRKINDEIQELDMLVGDWMTEEVLTLMPGAPIINAMEMMRDAGIRQIPVTEASGLVVGIVSDRDVRDAMPSKFLPGDNAAGKGDGLMGLKIKDIMTHDPYIVSPDTCMEVAAEILLERNRWFARC